MTRLAIAVALAGTRRASASTDVSALMVTMG